MAKNVSNDFKNIIKSGGPFYAYAEVTLSNGVKLLMTSEDVIISEGNSYSENSESGFPLGAAISKSIQITIDGNKEVSPVLDHDEKNIKDTLLYDIYGVGLAKKRDFYNAKVTFYTEADLPNGKKERIQEGIFTVIDSVRPGDEIEIVAYDDMYKADNPFVSTLTYPASAQMLLNEVCQKCDISLGSVAFKNNNFQILQPPEGHTGRQVIGYIAQIAGGNAIIDQNGRLVIKSYDFSGFDVDETVTAGETETKSGIHIISEYTTDPDIGTDDVTITGLSVTIESEDSSEDDEVYIVGSEDYAIEIDNPLIVGKEKEALELISESIIGLSARPFSGDFFPNPAIEFMDLVYVIDIKNNCYKTFITSNNFTYLGSSHFECGLESPQRNGGSYYSTSSEIYRKTKQKLKINKTQWEQAIENLTQRVANASGLFTTEEEQPDGSIIFYMHNKLTLGESDIVWKMTAETLTVSTDGGKTWNAGITVNGEVIARIMNTIGINFDWGVGGTLIIQDEFGNQTAYIDSETGEVRLSVTSLTVKGKTPEEIAESKIDYFIQNEYAPIIDKINSQIDQKIETFYQDTDPSLSWSWQDLQDVNGQYILDYLGSQIVVSLGNVNNEHIGDLWYNTSNNDQKTYRWDGEKWSETKTNPPEEVFDIIDGKGRIFISQPVPPYSEGDLWFNGSSSDIMTCIKSRGTGAYVSTDWEKRNKYTDDTAVNELDDSLNQTDIFNRLTNNGDTQGIYLQEEKIYINGTYIQSGVISVKNSNGKETFYANVDTGEVRINATSFSLSDGTTLSSILEDSKEYTDDKISDIDPSKNLTQSEIFNILTNNGQTQGIYLSGGKIYINASYISSGNLTANRIKGGTLTLGGSGNTNGILKILNSRGAQIGSWDNSGISASNAEVDGYFSASDGTRKISISGGEISLYYKNKQCAAINPSRYNSDDNQLGLDIQSTRKYLTLTLGDIIHLTIGQVVYDGDGFTYTNTWYGANLFKGRIKLINSFSCTGTKSRVVKTKNYGNRLQYCYEMPSPYFGDIGTSITDEFGESYISIDDIFSETASCNVEYQVFLQKEGMGDIWVEKKELTYFLVKGTPNLKFSWEIKVKQKDFEYERLDSEAFIEEDEENSVEKILTDEIEKYSENQEDLLWSIN